MSRKISIVVCGLGGVGRAFLELLGERRAHIEKTYHLSLVLTAAVDIGGAAVSGEAGGISPAALHAHLAKGLPVEAFPGTGRPGLSGVGAIGESGADVLVEATPTNLTDGEPGTGHILAALEKGMDVVSANKGPLVLYYRKLHDLAREKGGRLHISAATAAALPTLDVGAVCLAGAHIQSAEGILNGTTNYILTRMQQGCDYAAALQEAQKMGIAETNPAYDVEGRDTANKIILIANRLFGTFFGPQDIAVEGITRLTPADMRAAQAAGQVVKLIGAVERTDEGVQISVAPRRLSADHPLASVNGSEKAISYLTDTMARVTVMGGKSSTSGAAAAILKDLINAFA